MGLMLSSSFNRKFNIILYFRKYFFSIFIVFLHDNTYTQLAMISVLNIVLAILMLVKRPGDTKKENFKNFISEVLLIVA